eukprot:365534-Chlamydomonas_euryale.AAC.17
MGSLWMKPAQSMVSSEVRVALARCQQRRARVLHLSSVARLCCRRQRRPCTRSRVDLVELRQALQDDLLGSLLDLPTADELVQDEVDLQTGVWARVQQALRPFPEAFPLHRSSSGPVFSHVSQAKTGTSKGREGNVRRVDLRPSCAQDE